jgi:dipeptidyl aminopeptidase/acylaminoacyl peptidase
MPFTAWSPDGTMAVIPGTSNAKGYPTDLYLYKPEENSWRELAQFNFVDGAIWSPDGQWIAMRVQDGLGNVDIFVIQPDGSRLRNLTGVNFADPGDVGYLNIHAWLDDQVIIGTRDLNQESSVFYFVHPLEGEFEKSLSLSSYSIFSNTVNRLVIVRDVSSHIKSLDAIHPDGRIDYTIFTVNDQEISNLIWAPDGEKIAFLVRNSDKFSTQVFITNSDGSGITQFPADTMLFSLAFSPDSKYVLADNHSSLYVANLESSELDIFPGLPSDWFALFPSWQPPIH